MAALPAPFAHLGLNTMSEPTTVVCTTACTVTHVLTASSGMDPERVQDYTALFGAFVAAAVAVLCARALYSYFRIDHHERT